MRAARFHGSRTPIAIDDLPDPRPGFGEVVVRVAACGICASDLHFVNGDVPLPVRPPITLGHEASGTIEAVGADVPGWREGDRVSLTGGRPCMACPSCLAGRVEECENFLVMGSHYDGAWAELLRVPASQLVRLPDSVSFEHGAIACDAVATPFAALTDRGALRPGERVGIWGIGGLGTHAVQIARLAGASFVLAVDPLPAARERATALGADLALDPSEDVPSALRAATGGRGLDVAVEMVGVPAAVKQALTSLARGGRVVVAGQSLETLDAGPILALSWFGLSLLGHLGYERRHLEDVIELIARGRLDLSASVSDRLPLDAINDGIERLTRKDEPTVRLVVLPNG